MQLSSITMPYFRLYRDKIYINKSYYNWPDTRVIDFFNVYCISKRAGARFVVSQFVFISVETAWGRRNSVLDYLKLAIVSSLGKGLRHHFFFI